MWSNDNILLKIKVINCCEVGKKGHQIDVMQNIVTARDTKTPLGAINEFFGK